MAAYECDENGERRIHYMRGSDPTDPGKIIPYFNEIRPGGMTVARQLPVTRMTVAPDPVAPPSLRDVEEERRRRADESVERERQAIAQEREARGLSDDDPGAGTAVQAARPVDEETVAARQEREERERTAREQVAAKRGRPRTRA